MKQGPPSWLLLGMSTIPVSGILGAAVLLLRGPLTFPLTVDSGWIELASSANFLVYQNLLIVSYVLPFAGFLALYEYLRKDAHAARLAGIGLILTLLGTALALPASGVLSFVASSASQLGLADQAKLGQIITEAITGSGMVIGITAAASYTTGPLLFGIAMWRHANLSNLAAGMFIVHGALLSFGFAYFPALILGWIVLAVSGLMLSFDIWRASQRHGGAAAS